MSGELLRAYIDTHLTPEEITANMEMFAAYRHVCGGLAPEEIEKLVKAQQDGRLVELPCKVGDMVYKKEYPQRIDEDGSVWSVLTNKGATIVAVPFNIHMLDSARKLRNFYWITRAEAEAALKEAQK